MKKPIVVVDGRVFSTEAHDRGMGRYVKFLMQTILKSGYDICLIEYKNSHLINRPDLSTLFSTKHYLDIDPSSHTETDPHKSSFFIEQIISFYNAVAFINSTPFLLPLLLDITACPVICVLYDLIPYRNPETYLFSGGDFPTVCYNSSLRRLMTANGIIAISNSSKNEAIRYLGIDEKKIEVIYPTLDEIYITPSRPTNKTLDFFSFVGGHFSKNTKVSLNLINQLVKSGYENYQICVPTRSQKDLIKTKFSELCKNLILKHSITEETKYTYQSTAKVILHFSREEGFGIPLLEALFLETKVICCDTKINREIFACIGDDPNKIAILVPVNADQLKFREVSPFIDVNIENDTLIQFKKLKDFFIAHWQNAPNTICKIILKSQEDHQYFMGKVQYKMTVNVSQAFCGVSDYAHSLYCSIQGNVILYTKDPIIHRLNIPNNILIKSHLNYEQDLKIKAPTIFHLAISDTLWFGIELMLKYGTPSDIAIIHDHLLFYGIYYRYIHNEGADAFLNTYFTGADEIFKKNLKNDNLLSLEKFGEIFKGYNFDWLKQIGIKLVSHLTEAGETEHRKHRGICIPIEKQYIDIGITDRATPQVLRTAKIWRASKNFSNSDFVIGIFGSITSNKFIREIAKAIVTASTNQANLGVKEDIRLHILICGVVHDKDTFNQVKNYFEKIDKRFHYEAPVEEHLFDSLIAAADIVASCRKQDRGQLSHIIPRAMSLGRPIITNSASGYEMITKDLMINEEEFENDCAKKIIELAIDHGRRKSISIRNRELFSQKYNAQKMVSELNKINQKEPLYV